LAGRRRRSIHRSPPSEQIDHGRVGVRGAPNWMFCEFELCRPIAIARVHSRHRYALSVWPLTRRVFTLCNGHCLG